MGHVFKLKHHPWSVLNAIPEFHWSVPDAPKQRWKPNTVVGVKSPAKSLFSRKIPSPP